MYSLVVPEKSWYACVYQIKCIVKPVVLFVILYIPVLKDLDPGDEILNCDCIVILMFVVSRIMSG